MSAPNQPQPPQATPPQGPQSGPPHAPQGGPPDSGGPYGNEPPKRLKGIFHWTPWFIFAAILVLCVWVWMQWDQYESDKRYQTTDNATIHKEVTLVDAQISGYVKNMHFEDFQAVKAGDLLVELVDDQYQAAVHQAQAEVARAEAQLNNLAHELSLQKAGIEQASAQRENANASLELAQRDYQRFKQLANTGAVTKQEYDRAKSALDQARAQVRAQHASVNVQQRQLAVLESREAERSAALASAKAHLETAQINLGYTKIAAPRDGVVGKREVQIGTLVTPRTQVAALIQHNPTYIIANYKETQLANVKTGQKVTVSVDSFPDQTLIGTVSRLAPASGTALSLLVADNATGNFTKVVQRIPVRIDLNEGQALLPQLRGGMSVTTEIDTESKGTN